MKQRLTYIFYISKSKSNICNNNIKDNNNNHGSDIPINCLNHYSLRLCLNMLSFLVFSIISAIWFHSGESTNDKAF